jgi:hypothetical protein
VRDDKKKRLKFPCVSTKDKFLVISLGASFVKGALLWFCEFHYVQGVPNASLPLPNNSGLYYIINIKIKGHEEKQQGYGKARWCKTVE